MVFVPTTAGSARTLRAGSGNGPGRAFAATSGLSRGLGPGTDPEELDFAALSAAGVAALDGLAGPSRLVLAADVDPGQVTDRGGELGEVGLAGLRWAQVQALFADEAEAAEAVRAAALVATGRPLPEAFALPEVVALVDAFDLLWYDPAEIDALT